MRKLCLINGASGGIGSSIASELSTDYDLYLLGRHQEKLEEIVEELKSRCKVEYNVVDFCKTETLKDVLESLQKDNRSISCLINSVGVVPVGKFLDIKDEEWINAFEISFMSAVKLIKTFSPLMKSNGGNIVLINGMLAIQPDPNFVVSSSIAGALRNFAKAISKDLAKYNIRVNSIMPGATSTGLWDSIGKSLNIELEKLWEQISEANPLGRLGTPTDIAKAVRFLCSDFASYINGCSINIDGGASLAL